MLSQMTCEIQHRIGWKFSIALGEEDFENTWMATDVSTRKEHALRALANACSLANNLNTSRVNCADVLRVNHLGQDGRVLLDLLKAITPDDLSTPPKEPHYIPARPWDALKAQQERSSRTTELEKYALQDLLLLRTKLICEYLTSILCFALAHKSGVDLVAEGMIDSFFGRKLPSVTVQKQHDPRTKVERTEDMKRLTSQMKALYGRQEGLARVREDTEAFQDRKALRGRECTHCRKHEKEDEKFQRCKKCWDNLQREVMYCCR